ncbi:Secretory carrier-associated membrane protein 5 [Irineochytrium annulatum]|nr:Secretory carrier-associated membrane protein 5 [Irineochytrium annulatum]
MSNPFEENPFEDGNTRTHNRNGSSSGNPWGLGSGSSLSSVRKHNASTASSSALNSAPPRPTTPAGPAGAAGGNGGFKVASIGGGVGSGNGGGGYSQREADLEKREAELRNREARLNERENAMGDYKPPNWPPCRPIVYHDIENDIPDSGKWLVKRLYYAFFLSSAAYFMNFVAAFALLVVKAESAGGNFGLALVIFLVGTPVSFTFWCLLKDVNIAGVKHDRSIQFFLFFFNYGFHLAVSALLAVGIPGWGGAGVIYTLSEIGDQIGTGILCAIASGLLGFEVLYGLWQIKAVSSYFKSRGMTSDQAKQQAISGFANSGVGRDITAAAIKSSMAPDTRK